MRAFCHHLTCYAAMCQSCHVKFDMTDEWRAANTVNASGARMYRPRPRLTVEHRTAVRRGLHRFHHTDKGVVNPMCEFCQ